MRGDFLRRIGRQRKSRDLRTRRPKAANLKLLSSSPPAPTHIPPLTLGKMEQDQSSYAPFARMQTSRDVLNPLRPYYIPPSIGLLPDPAEADANAIRGASVGPSSRSRDFRELFSDIDYGDYLPGSSPSVAAMAKRLMDQAIWNYTSVFLAQPFEVAKVVLQCHMAGSSVPMTSQPQSSGSSKRFNQDGYVDARYDVGSPFSNSSFSASASAGLNRDSFSTATVTARKKTKKRMNRKMRPRAISLLPHRTKLPPPLTTITIDAENRPAAHTRRLLHPPPRMRLPTA